MLSIEYNVATTTDKPPTGDQQGAERAADQTISRQSPNLDNRPINFAAALSPVFRLFYLQTTPFARGGGKRRPESNRNIDTRTMGRLSAR